MWQRSAHCDRGTHVKVSWRKSSHSSAGECVEVGADWQKTTHTGTGECVEVRSPEIDTILIRDSKDPDGPVLTFNGAEWDAFIKGAKDGEFDLSSM